MDQDQPPDPGVPRLGQEPTQADGFRRQSARSAGPAAMAATLGEDEWSGATRSDAQESPGLTGRGLPPIEGYEVLEEIGRGGMGVVYRARQIRLNRPCALKMILAADHVGPEATVRFLAEAETIARLSHPNIVQVHTLGDYRGRLYFEMEYIEGGSLDRALNGSPRAATEAAALVETLARAVAEAHHQGVIHRDLKPANILIAADGTPKVSDFGLAKSLTTDSGLTQTASILGSPSYMAPEQAEGGTRQVGVAADIYSLGAILYELVVGRPPFRGPTILDTLEQVRSSEPVPPSRLVPRLPRDLETIVLKCLRKEADRRYPSSEALADDLRRFLANRPILARPTAAPERLIRWSRRHPAVASLVAAVLIASTIGTVTSTYFKLQADARAASDRRNAQLAEDRQEQAQRAEQQARRSAEEGRQQLVRLGVVSGRSLDSSNQAAALLWYINAWRLDRVDPTTEASHRLRIGSALAALPPMVGLCVHPTAVEQAEFAPDGRRLLTRGGGREVYLWDFERSRLATPPLGHDVPVRKAVWSSDGSQVATASGRVVRIWDGTSGQSIRDLDHPDQVADLAFAPVGSLLATACADGRVRLWNPVQGDLAHPAIEAGGPVESVAFDRSGQRLCTGSRPGAARVWDAATGAAISPELPHNPRSKLDQQFGWAPDPALSPDGIQVATISAAGWTVHDVSTGATVFGPYEQPKIGSLRWSPDGASIAAQCQSEQLLVHQLRPATSSPLLHPRNLSFAEFSPDGALILTASSGGLIHLWDAQSGRKVWQPQQSADFARRVAFSRDGRRVLSASLDGTVRVWDREAWSHHSGPVARSPGTALKTTLTMDGRSILASRDGALHVTFGGELSHVVEIHRADPHEVRASITLDQPAANVVVADAGDRCFTIEELDERTTLRCWSLTTGQEVAPRITIPGAIKLMAIARGGTRVATADSTRRITLWDVASARVLGKPIAVRADFPRIFGPPERDGLISRLVLADDGSRVAAFIESSGTLGVWDTATGKQLSLAPKRYRGFARSAEFASDGRLVLSSSDTLARVFDTEGRIVGPPLRHTVDLFSSRFAPTGPFVLTVDTQTARIWDSTNGDMLDSIRFEDHLQRTRQGFTADFATEGRQLIIGNGSIQRAIDLPIYVGTGDQAASLADLMAGQRLESTGGMELLDPFTFKSDPARYRQAWLAWRGLPDDPGAQPGPTPPAR